MPGHGSTPRKNNAKAPPGRIECHPSPALAVRCCVYLPPGYRAGGKTKYPVLYLLHGVGDTEKEWDKKAGLTRMLDGLIRRKKVRKLVVVLPFGFLTEAQQVDRTRPNSELFTDHLLNQIMPAIEGAYSIDTGKRAIAGISMGGRQALEAGFAHPDKFAMIGGFSAAIQNFDPLTRLPASRNPPPVCLRCGRRDYQELLKSNEDLVEDLLAKQLRCDPAEKSGLDVPDRKGQIGSPKDPHQHNWYCWTPALKRFFPALSRALAKA